MNISTTKNTSTITVELPAKVFPYPSLRCLTNSISKIFLDLNSKWLQRMELIIDELCNNAAEHGSGPNDLIKITFIIEPNSSIYVKVEDEGNGKEFDIEEIYKHIDKHQKMGSSDIVLNQTIRGRGLAHIVTKWANKWKISKNKSGGMTFHVTINKE